MTVKRRKTEEAERPAEQGDERPAKLGDVVVCGAGQFEVCSSLGRPRYYAASVIQSGRRVSIGVFHTEAAARQALAAYVDPTPPATTPRATWFMNATV